MQVVTSEFERRADYGPPYDVDPSTGADMLGTSFDTSAGWYWWNCRRGPTRYQLGGIP